MERSLETCPDCGRSIAIGAREIERGRARCPTCALDVGVEMRTHGDGPERAAQHVALIAPPAPPSQRLRVVRYASRLVIEWVEEERSNLLVGIVGGILGVALGIGLTIGLAIYGFGAWVAVLAAPLAGLAIRAIVSTGSRASGPAVVVTGGQASYPRPLERVLTVDELRWVREIVDARIAGDSDR